MKTIHVCPGTLAPGFDTYSPSCLRKVFEGKKVSHILDFYMNDDTEMDIVAASLFPNIRVFVSDIISQPMNI